MLVAMNARNSPVSIVLRFFKDPLFLGFRAFFELGVLFLSTVAVLGWRGEF